MTRRKRETDPDPEFYERAARELEQIAEIMRGREGADDSVIKRLRELAEAVRGRH